MSGIVGGIGRSGIVGRTVGITEYDSWRVNVDTAGDLDPIINWERDTTNSGAPFGTGMTQTDTNSGRWTFPSTGIWQVTFTAFFSLVTPHSSRNNDLYIYMSPDSGDNYNVVSYNSAGIANAESSTTYNASTAIGMVDVASTTTTWVYFAVYVNNNLTKIRGNSGAANETSATFMRIGDR